jgi:hypothetical protein
LPRNMLLRVAYIGSRTMKLHTKVVSNRAEPVPGIPTTTATINQRRPDPRFLEISTYTNMGIGYFDGVQFGLDKRMNNGLALNVRYTFSKAIASADVTFNQIAGGVHASQNEDVVRDLKALARYDTPHAFSIGYSYVLPWARGLNGLRGHVLDGWELSGTTTYKTGAPTHIHTGSDAPGFGNVDGVGGDRPNLLNPAILGKCVCHPDTTHIVYNPAFFDVNLTPGGRGNIGYETFRNDGTHNWNMAIAKRIRLPEAAGREPQLQFRTEFYNLMNQAQFDELSHNIASETFPKITNTVNKGRVLQLSLKLQF